MRRSAGLWTLAVILTVFTLVWQRTTGPTYPLRGRVRLGGTPLTLRLERSHSVAADQPVRILARDSAVAGSVQWKRYPSTDAWDTLPLVRHGDTLVAALPRQPAAGKLAYQVRLSRGGERAIFPAEPAITRFKGDISAYVIVPHLLCLFIGLLHLMRSGIGVLAREPKYPRWARAGTVLFLLGGFVFGPWMQHQAFGQWWAGVPFGWDLTDNKTLIALVAWLVALWRLRGGKEARGPVLVAALLTLAVFLVPHSVLGSQIDWTKAGAPGAR